MGSTRKIPWLRAAFLKAEKIRTARAAQLGQRNFVNHGAPDKKTATAPGGRFRAPVFFQTVLLKIIFIASVAAGLTRLPVHAQTTNLSNRVTDDLPAPPPGIWADDLVGDGFRRGLAQSGFALGAGIAAHSIGNRISHRLALARIYYGWMLGNVVGRDRWYRGNWEIMAEIFGGAQFYPARRYAVGETTVLRYNFATGTRWVPFFDAGAGILGTDIGPPDLGTTFEFNEQFGPGVNYFWRKNSALTLQYRFTHISNAGIREPNQGVNEQMFYAGVTWYF